MKQLYQDIVWALVLGFVIPACLFSNGIGAIRDSNNTETEPIVQNTATMVTLLQSSGAVEEIEMQEYIVCVVLKEMPAYFEFEALKAQSVVARTYAMKRLNGNAKHPKAALCANPQCCQGYCTVEAYLNQGGKQEDVDKIRQAVAATDNVVVLYHNALIDATYFSCSGGVTEDAKSVWGQDVPYLQSVESPGEEKSTYFTDTMTFTLDKFQSMLGQKIDGNPSGWIKRIRYTDGNGVESITIGDVTYSGTTIRSKLGLRSTAFTITISNSGVVIATKGYGHRVGMSQYGADAMALSGKSYIEILKHYYNGVDVVPYFPGD